jgi:hypothetical protein
LYWCNDYYSIKLSKTYNEEEFDIAIIVVGLSYEEMHREIDNENKLIAARIMNNKGTQKGPCKLKSYSQMYIRKKPYDQD